VFSKFIDHYALSALHKKKSSTTQFAIPVLPTEINREDFYQPDNPSFQTEVTADYQSNTYSFTSFIATEYPNNDFIKGEMFLQNNKGVTPNIILIHGWRMNSYSKLKSIYHDKMSSLGWNLYYFPLAYHMERTPPPSLYSGEFMISANLDRTVHATKQSIVDLRTLIHWIKQTQEGPIVLVGVSLGGWIANLAATLEAEIDGVISVFYANRLSHSIWNTIPGKYIKADFLNNGIGFKELIEHWGITDPSGSLPKIKKENILLISGKHDQYISLEDADHLWQSWGKPARHVYNCGHSGIVLNKKRIAKDTISFIQEQVLKTFNKED